MRAQFYLAFVAAWGVTSQAQPLRQLADRRGIRIGAAADPEHLGETPYGATLSGEFSQIEPENAMKFGPIHPGPSSYNFGPADSLVSFAEANHMSVRGHTLVWHNQLPSWVTSGGLTPSQLSSILSDHIRTVVGRYAGQTYAWDVVNEAFTDDGTLRSTIWSNAPGIGLPGTAYIEQAFRWAHEADPQALLFYNDYDAQSLNTKSDAIYAMAQDFKSRGVPFDGVGMQMHLTTTPPPLASMQANLKRLTDLGLQVQITELDVRLPVDSSGNATAADLATQAQIYHNITALCLEFPRCTAVQTWEFTDKYSWVPSMYPGFGAALEFDANYTSKPAYATIKAALQMICDYTVNLGGAAFTAQGGTGMITITTMPGCAWTVGSLPAWITLTSVGSGTGSGSVSFQVHPNSGADQSGSFTIAGQSFTIEQEASSISGLSFIGSMPHALSDPSTFRRRWHGHRVPNRAARTHSPLCSP